MSESPWNGRTLLVTGAAGWLGVRLTDTLLSGLPDAAGFPAPENVRIRCLVLPGDDSAPLTALGDSVEIVTGDVTDSSSCAELCQGERMLLFHTAGVIHPKRVRDFERVNTEGTTTLLEAARAAGVERAVVVSSNSPIGTNPSPDHRFDESSPYNPYMGYGRSKMLMEQRVHDVDDLPWSIVRPPWFYGPYQPPRQTLFFEMIRDGKGPVVGGGNNYRSMVYIDNLCQGLMLAASRAEAVGETYWIADAEPYTMNQVLDTVERLMEEEFGFEVAHRRLRLPGLASEVALAVDWALQSVGLYHQKVHVLSEMNKTIACTIDKARAELGYAPAVALEEGMRRSLRWCIDRGLLSP